MGKDLGDVLDEIQVVDELEGDPQTSADKRLSKHLATIIIPVKAYFPTVLHTVSSYLSGRPLTCAFLAQSDEIQIFGPAEYFLDAPQLLDRIHTISSDKVRIAYTEEFWRSAPRQLELTRKALTNGKIEKPPKPAPSKETHRPNFNKQAALEEMVRSADVLERAPRALFTKTPVVYARELTKSAEEHGLLEEGDGLFTIRNFARSSQAKSDDFWRNKYERMHPGRVQRMNELLALREKRREYIKTLSEEEQAQLRPETKRINLRIQRDRRLVREFSDSGKRLLNRIASYGKFCDQYNQSASRVKDEVPSVPFLVVISQTAEHNIIDAYFPFRGDTRIKEAETFVQTVHRNLRSRQHIRNVKPTIALRVLDDLQAISIIAPLTTHVHHTYGSLKYALDVAYANSTLSELLPGGGIVQLLETCGLHEKTTQPELAVNKANRYPGLDREVMNMLPELNGQTTREASLLLRARGVPHTVAGVKYWLHQYRDAGSVEKRGSSHQTRWYAAQNGKKE